MGMGGVGGGGGGEIEERREGRLATIFILAFIS